MSSDAGDWLTTEQLAAEMGRPVEWVQRQFACGAIPGIKIARRWYFTPECRAELMRRHLGNPMSLADVVEPPPVEDDWGRIGARGQQRAS